jgi:hypothetical protein
MANSKINALQKANKLLEVIEEVSTDDKEAVQILSLMLSFYKESATHADVKAEYERIIKESEKYVSGNIA